MNSLNWQLLKLISSAHTEEESREMLVKNRDLSLLNSSGIIIERTFLTKKEETKRKEYLNYAEFNSHTSEKVERSQRNSVLKMFGHLIGKFY